MRWPSFEHTVRQSRAEARSSPAHQTPKFKLRRLMRILRQGLDLLPLEDVPPLAAP